MLQNHDDLEAFRHCHLHRLVNELKTNDFNEFIRRAFTTVNPAQPYLPGWHIELIAEHLEACHRGEITRLIINLPPRSLKSICISVAWPAWILGHNPAARIMAASYSQGLANKHSMDCRMLLQSEWYRARFPHTRIGDEQNEKHKFITTERGMRMASSVWGTATGEGGQFLIADDIMNPAQAASRVEREKVCEWFDHTFSTRLDDKRKGVIVLVMQRLHAADITAHLLQKGGWERISLPAIAEEEVSYRLGRKIWRRLPGSLLHAAREDAPLLARAQKELGSIAFAAQYQQEPLPAEGGMIKREWFVRF